MKKEPQPVAWGGILVCLLMLLIFSSSLPAQRRSQSRKSATTTMVPVSSTVAATSTSIPTTTLLSKSTPAPLGIPDSSPDLPQGASWFGMFGAFLFVVALAALGALGVSYWMKGKVWPWKRGGDGSMSHQPIQVLESIPLGQRRYLTVIAIGDEKHLLGLSPGSIQYLTKLSSEAASAYGSGRKNPADKLAERGSFPRRSRYDVGQEKQEIPSDPKSPSEPGTFEEEYRKLKARLGGK